MTGIMALCPRPTPLERDFPSASILGENRPRGQFSPRIANTARWRVRARSPRPAQTWACHPFDWQSEHQELPRSFTTVGPRSGPSPPRSRGGLDPRGMGRPSATDAINRDSAEAESVRARSPPQFVPGRTATSPNTPRRRRSFTFSANVATRPDFAPRLGKLYLNSIARANKPSGKDGKCQAA
jgi:hypothetical protein